MIDNTNIFGMTDWNIKVAALELFCSCYSEKEKNKLVSKLFLSWLQVIFEGYKIIWGFFPPALPISLDPTLRSKLWQRPILWRLSGSFDGKWRKVDKNLESLLKSH
jgi:hypothetical protein